MQETQTVPRLEDLVIMPDARNLFDLNVGYSLKGGNSERFVQEVDKILNGKKILIYKRMPDDTMKLCTPVPIEYDRTTSHGFTPRLWFKESEDRYPHIDLEESKMPKFVFLRDKNYPENLIGLYVSIGNNWENPWSSKKDDVSLGKDYTNPWVLRDEYAIVVQK